MKLRFNHYTCLQLFYVSCLYLPNNLKTSVTDSKLFDNKIFNEYVNYEKVVIEHVFKTLQNQ